MQRYKISIWRIKYVLKGERERNNEFISIEYYHLSISNLLTLSLREEKSNEAIQVTQTRLDWLSLFQLKVIRMEARGYISSLMGIEVNEKAITLLVILFWSTYFFLSLMKVAKWNFFHNNENVSRVFAIDRVFILRSSHQELQKFRNVLFIVLCVRVICFISN